MQGTRVGQLVFILAGSVINKYCLNHDYFLQIAGKYFVKTSIVFDNFIKTWPYCFLSGKKRKITFNELFNSQIRITQCDISKSNC